MNPPTSQDRGAAITLTDVSHVYPGPPRMTALKNVSLEARAGGFTAIIGPSGCGKSTILKALAGLLQPSSGSVHIDGRDVGGKPGSAAYMPQGSALLPWRRVSGNAVLGAEVSGMSREHARARAEELYEQFGLSGFEESWPWQLSGGMRQRLALLRTFLTPKPVLLLDEPLGALDAITRRSMQGWLQDVWRRDGRTMLLVSHDVEEALVLSDVIYVMSPRPGRIVGRIDVPLARPRTFRDAADSTFITLKTRLLELLETAGGDSG